MTSSKPPASSSKRLRLRTTLVVPFVLQIVTAVGLVGYLSFRSSQQAVNDLASQLRSEVTARVRERINTYVQAPVLVNQVNIQAVDLGVINFENVEAAQSYLWRQALVFKSIGYTGIANPRGQYLRVGWINRPAEKNSPTGVPSNQHNLDNTEPEKPQLAQQLNIGTGDLQLYNLDKDGQRKDFVKSTPNYDVRTRPFYKLAVDMGKPTWSEIYGNFFNPSLQISLTHPYYNKNGQLLGILTSQMGLNQVRDFLETLKIGSSGEVYIIEPSGNLVATSIQEQPLWLKTSKELQRISARESQNLLIRHSAEFLTKRFAKLEDIRQDYQLEFILQGQREFLQISPFTDEYGLNWLIVVVVPESDFMEQVNANNDNIIRMCVLALGLAIAIGIFTSRLITQPVLRLTQGSKELAAGNLDRQIETKDFIEIEEIDTLEHSFNSMAAQLKASFATLEAQRATLASQNEELQHFDQLKDEFLTNTSHELRTPLNGIIGIAESLIDGATGELPVPTQVNLQLIVSSGRRLASLINDILDFSKLKQKNLELQLAPVDLRSITQIVLTLSQPLAQQKNLQLINNISEELPSAEADENRLQQILHNLIGNAIKFTPAGTVKISAQVVSC